MYEEAWAIVGAIKSPQEARQAANKVAHMEGIDSYTFVKLIQAIEEQWKRWR